MSLGKRRNKNRELLSAKLVAARVRCVLAHEHGKGTTTAATKTKRIGQFPNLESEPLLIRLPMLLLPPPML